MAFSSGRNVLTISAQGKREREEGENRKGRGRERKMHRVKDCKDSKVNSHCSTEMIEGMKRSPAVKTFKSVKIFYWRLETRSCLYHKTYRWKDSCGCGRSLSPEGRSLVLQRVKKSGTVRRVVTVRGNHDIQ